MSGLAGRGAVVTGGGRGIGRAVAEALAAAGAAVVVCARSAAELESTAAAIREAGGDAHAIACDVTDPAAVERLAGEAGDRLGEVDILVNNAGASFAQPLRRLTLDQWNEALAVNATGPFLCTRAFLPAMVERGRGRVITVASVAGITGAPYIAAYAAAKHAAVGFVRAVAAEVAGSGVTVNAVCPGYVDTDMTRRSIDRIVEKTGRTEREARAAILERSPQGRLIAPTEVAHAVAFLCSDGAASINGEALVMDGGELRR
ncbi:MAG TPA: SDR family NAD(P)-dependent oxidoreductase [Longimicrobiales bacterium]|nr:SDR family NAD(P)-dependent oxidoreductase [Longimicrobiales bacterium]